MGNRLGKRWEIFLRYSGSTSQILSVPSAGVGRRCRRHGRRPMALFTFAFLSYFAFGPLLRIFFTQEKNENKKGKGITVNLVRDVKNT